MHSYIFDLHEINGTMGSVAGGKAANLGSLMRIPGILVPEGFCISAEVYGKVVGDSPQINALLAQLSLLKLEDGERIRELSGALRSVIEAIDIPAWFTEDVIGYLAAYNEVTAWAIRSSATAEDLPDASFAGQQDSYLNVVGREAILQHIRRCWASLFTERAVIYRIRNGYDHRSVRLAVIVQQMVFPEAAGILFTADPVTSNRKVLSIDASFGLGEALVSGLVNADVYKVRNGAIIDKKVAAKKLAIHTLKEGGTRKQEIEGGQQNKQALTDDQIQQLARIGRKIEAHFGYPQDVEWCVSGDTFYIVQSRPITTLFPIPEANDQEGHVYLSVGHQQMMTDAMRPLGLSIFQLMTIATMVKAGGRLFVDVVQRLATPTGREMLLNMMGQHNPLTKDALMTLIERGDIIRPLPADETDAATDKGRLPEYFQGQIEYDPTTVPDLIKHSRKSTEALKEAIQTRSGLPLLDLIQEDIQQIKKSLSDPRVMGVIMTAMNASLWINEKMNEWLGEKNASDTLSQSVSGNITSEMGLELMDVADVIRPYPEVIDYLQHAKDATFRSELVKCHGGEEAWDAIRIYLEKYGMRCAGEIDITRTRWSERPTMLVPMILSNIKNLAPNAGHQKFEKGRQEALDKEQVLLKRLKALPDGEKKSQETKRVIDLIRNLSGYREYPKYGIVSRFFIYKQALLREAEQLVQTGVLLDKEDIYYLTWEELRETVRAHQPDQQLIDKRKAEYRSFEKLTPPLVMTSEGEIVTGRYKRENLPAGAIVGLPVSSGIVEGRARVILQMDNAELDSGDILVTTFTDPSWTPLFVAIKGLVTEVGGLMTHGAVIAREYGLPAVVGVENATRLIQDGQRIRVNGTDGYVEILANENERPEFWEKSFTEKKEMWGFVPAKSALVARDLFAAKGLKKILIPGFGYGRNAQIFRDKGMTVTGIEISQTAIGMARKHYGTEMTIYHGSVTDMPFDNIEYDGIFCYALIHLLDSGEREKLIRDCYRQLAANGLMVFTVISKAAPTYGQGKPIGKDRYELFGGVNMYFYDRESIRAEFGKAGLVEVTEITENYPFFLITCRKGE